MLSVECNHKIFKLFILTKISDINNRGSDKEHSAKEALMLWVQRNLEGYPGIVVKDFTHSWRDGKAFIAILHRHK